VRLALLSDTATVVIPDEALLRVTVQVLLPPERIVVGAQTSDEIAAGGESAIEAVFELLFRVAVTTAVEAEAMVPAVAVKVPLDAPDATVAETGTVRLALSSDTATVVIPDEAPLRVTVHVALAADNRVVGEQTRDEMVRVGTERAMEAVFELAFKAAVTVAVEAEVMVPAVAVKVALVAPAAIVIEAGTVRPALLSDTATVLLADEALLRVTVQVLLPPDDRVAGVQARDEMVGLVERAIEAVLELPFRAAVTTAVVAEVMVPAVAAKVPLTAPAGMATDAGTASATLSLESATATPPAGAEPLRVAVQVAAPGVGSVDGVQVNALKVTETIT
jgi:hypothetical protein